MLLVGRVCDPGQRRALRILYVIAPHRQRGAANVNENMSLSAAAAAAHPAGQWSPAGRTELSSNVRWAGAEAIQKQKQKEKEKEKSKRSTYGGARRLERKRRPR